VRFQAHSDRSGLAEDAPGSRWQPLAEHPGDVGKFSRRLAQVAAPEFQPFQDLAEWAGLLHHGDRQVPVIAPRDVSGWRPTPRACGEFPLLPASVVRVILA